MGRRWYPRPGANVAGAVVLILAASLLSASAAGAATKAHHHTHRTGSSTPAPPVRITPTCVYPVLPTTTTTTTTTTTSTSTTSTTTTTPGSTTTTTTTTTTPPTSTTTTTAPPATTTSFPAPTIDKPAYYLVESNGGVHPFGGAAFRGSRAKPRQSGFVGAAATSDGAGYWLANAKGSVYGYGDATFFGSVVHVHHHAPIIAIAAAPAGIGYWLVASNGAVYNYGTAPFCGSLVHEKLASPIVAIAPAPDDGGYRLVAANGQVYGFGDETAYGAPSAAEAHDAVIAIANTADGNGYWVATTAGRVYRYGDAPYFGAPARKHIKETFASFVATADGSGYWFTSTSGRVFNYGDAGFAGSLAHTPPRHGITVVILMRSFMVLSGLIPLPHGEYGYDISNFQCTSPTSNQVMSKMPPTSGISIIEAAGWLDSANNHCLSSEVAWATKAAPPGAAPYNLYVFTNAPDLSTQGKVFSASGPRGTCAQMTGTTQADCIAYNYGYNGAESALSYASNVDVHAEIWWLDIENTTLSPTNYSSFSEGEYWSHDTELNDQTIQGAIDALRSAGIEVGIYSTSVQYPSIAGNFVPSGAQIPIWIAGVPWTNPPYSESGLASPSILASWCAGTASYAHSSVSGDIFAGGVPTILQETPGTLASPYGIDPDYTC
jgi:hypothetical protein